MDEITVLQFEGNAKVSWRAYRDAGGHWIAICDSLAVTTEGDTWSDLSEAIHETMQLMLSSLLRSGDLRRFLLEHGWTPKTVLPERGESRVKFDLPWTVAPQATPAHA